jgi:enolase-phosphatase E1
MHSFRGISHLLLDIEGTTCPVQFVAETLFPFAAARLMSFVQQHGRDADVIRLLNDVQEAWLRDADPEAVALLQRDPAPEGLRTVPYLQLLIRQDRKLPALKDLQGLIWKAGYASGELVAPLFDDVADALHRWHGSGVVLAVYSSGSVPAQQLLYGHCSGGDLRDLFSYWFDSRTGPKHESASYGRIAEAMGVAPAAVLFISDSLMECEAARRSGMAVLFSDRPGNPQRDAGRFETITDYSGLVIQP